MIAKAGEPRKKILVGISGGANSAVAAALLKSQGFDVQGVFLQIQDPHSKTPSNFGARCCLTKNPLQAREVCRKLDIPFQVIRVESQFEDRVIDGFIHDLLQGRLPNPCISCHLRLRFETLLQKADELGCEQVATGHHAQILRDAAGVEGVGVSRLSRAANTRKDQSFFLFGLNQKQLGRLNFPLGGFQDTMVGKLAREFELPTESEGDPQEICLSRGDAYISFFESRVAPSLRLGGNIKMNDGSVLGEHSGLHGFRVGQTKLKLATHVKDASRYIVTGFEVAGHALVVGSEKDLFQTDLRATRATWIRPMDGLRGLKTFARFSPAQKEAVPCRVTHFENGVLRVELESPCKGLITGSAIVFYDDDEVLGGAYISTVGCLPQGE